MLNYNSPIKDNKTYTDLNIKEVGPVMKINLRGSKREFLTVVGKTLNIILPNEPNTSVSSEKLTAMWLSPDEWLVISNNIIEKENNIYELEDLLNNNISKAKLGSVVSVTDHFTMFNLEGKNIYELLASSCPFNFDKFKKEKDQVIQTVLNHIDVIIHHKNIDNINLFVRRSFSNHLWSWMNDGAKFL